MKELLKGMPKVVTNLYGESRRFQRQKERKAWMQAQKDKLNPKKNK